VAQFKPAAIKPNITLAEFQRLDIRLGTIVSVEDLPNSAKLLRLRVDLGDHRRTILAGMKGERALPQEMVGQQEVAAVMPSRDHAIVERDDVALHLFSPDSGTPSAASIHVLATGLDELFSELESRGALIRQGIVRKPRGNRESRVVDASGHIIKFTEATG